MDNSNKEKMAETLISKEAQGKQSLMNILITEQDNGGSSLSGNYNGAFLVQAIAHLVRFLLALAKKSDALDNTFKIIVNAVALEYANAQKLVTTEEVKPNGKSK